MRFSNAKLLTCALALLVAACAPMTAQTSAAQETKNQRMVLNWWREVVLSGHVDLVPKYMADSYIEHDPNINGGRADFIAYYGKKGSKPIPKKLPSAPAQAFAKGDYVVLVFAHPDKDPKTSTAYEYFTYDVVRVKDGKIQEHWDSARK